MKKNQFLFLSIVLALVAGVFAFFGCAEQSSESASIVLPFLFGTVSNTLITPKAIAREALVRLQSSKVFAALFHTDYANEFQQKGDTVTVRKPAVLTANEFSTDIVPQNVTEGSVDVKLDTIADVSVEVTSKEMSLDIVDFGTQVVEGAVLGIQELIDQKCAGLYLDIPYFAGTSGDSPDSLTDIAAGMVVLNRNKCPMNMRRMVIDPVAHGDLVTIDAIAGLDKSGSTDALREASIGRILGFDSFMSQNIKTHTAGVAPTAGTPLVNARVLVGATTIPVKGLDGATDGVIKGDILSIGGDQYVATATVAGSGSVVAIPVYPAVVRQLEANDAVVFPDKTAKAHTANLLFHRNAFAFVNRPLALPMGATSENAYVASANGIAIRVVMSYNATTKKNMISFDTLFGVKTLYPELACRLLG